MTNVLDELLGRTNERPHANSESLDESFLDRPFLMDKGFLEERLNTMCQNYKQNKGEDKDLRRDLIKNATRIVLNNPDEYLCYGIYWYALKTVLYQATQNPRLSTKQMSIADKQMADIYAVKDANGEVDRLLTVVAAMEFRDYYMDTYFWGSAEWEIGNDEVYYLHDEEFLNQK